eukprot:Em0020g528a
MWSHVTWGSYLDLPRLTFTGWVHVDVATMNNSPCNFDINRPELILPPSEWNWNTNGTGEFKLFNCFVTSALTTNPLDIPDAIIDSKVVSNFNMPYAKIVDLDVQHQLSSEIYGLHLAIVRSNGDIAFQARAETMPLVQDMWTRRICNLSLADRNMGSKAVTVLTGITWGNTAGSPVLQEFKALTAKSHRNLSITFNVFNFNEVGQNLATLVGAIGVAFENESLHFAGHNVEIYKRIRSVVMQEMQHMIQAANILIAIGGKPMIDSKEHAPSYPGSLPGGVLPNLRITLEKLSKQHVYEVLMGIEVPHNISLDSDNPEIFNDTIGQFYKEIQVCIEDLKDKDIFSDESLVNKQMEWPWDAPSVGTVVIIKDHATAIEAVQGIMNQGEGTSPLDPSVGSSAVGPPFLAHFYNFEEIVCQKHLALDEDGRFCYSGDPIPFDPTGVWPMLPNLDKNKIPAFSRCYIAARNFHGAWRALLRKLQEVFDGNIGGMMDSIALMHTLAVHGHKVMQINIEGTEENCGPVWDYEWN